MLILIISILAIVIIFLALGKYIESNIDNPFMVAFIPTALAILLVFILGINISLIYRTGFFNEHMDKYIDNYNEYCLYQECNNCFDNVLVKNSNDQLLILQYDELLDEVNGFNYWTYYYRLDAKKLQVYNAYELIEYYLEKK